MHGWQIKRKLTAETHSAEKYTFIFLKWVVISAVTGAFGGFIGGLFHMSVNAATEVRSAHPFIILLLPVMGVVITWIYHISGFDNDGGTNLIINSVRTKDHVPLRMAPLIFISTVLTHLAGGSAGREGAALQLGGSIGNRIGELFKVKKEDMSISVMCGMSALFSALFGTPLTACFFAMEVISVGVIYYAGLVPCMTASLTAFGISRLMRAEPTRFDISGHIPKLGAAVILKACLFAVVCAAASIVFCVMMKTVRKLLTEKISSKYLRAAFGGAAVLLLTFIVRSYDYNGAGMDVIERALYQGEAKPAAFFLKMIFTALTIGAGFKGGEIVPTMFIGATLGCSAAPVFGLDPCFGAALGIAALFCSVVNCPAAAIFLSLELFGGDATVIFAAVCCVSYMLSGYYGLYSSQRIVYSKLHTRYINRKTK